MTTSEVPTRLVFEPDRTHLALPATPSGPLKELSLPIGPGRLAAKVFSRELPSPVELEQAIEVVENALDATGLAAEPRGELVTTDAVVRQLPGLAVGHGALSRADVESLFQRLASASLGQPSAALGLPAGREAAATLLLLRELMHHLGFEAVRVADHPR